MIILINLMLLLIGMIFITYNKKISVYVYQNFKKAFSSSYGLFINLDSSRVFYVIRIAHFMLGLLIIAGVIVTIYFDRSCIAQIQCYF